MDMGGRVSEIIWILCIKVSLLMQAYACDKGLCEIALNKHHLVNIYQSAVAFELICTDNSFFIIYLNNEIAVAVLVRPYYFQSGILNIIPKMSPGITKSGCLACTCSVVHL